MRKGIMHRVSLTYVHTNRMGNEFSLQYALRLIAYITYSKV